MTGRNFSGRKFTWGFCLIEGETFSFLDLLGFIRSLPRGKELSLHKWVVFAPCSVCYKGLSLALFWFPTLVNPPLTTSPRKILVNIENNFHLILSCFMQPSADYWPCPVNGKTFTRLPWPRSKGGLVSRGCHRTKLFIITSCLQLTLSYLLWLSLGDRTWPSAQPVPHPVEAETPWHQDSFVTLACSVFLHQQSTLWSISSR